MLILTVENSQRDLLLSLRSLTKLVSWVLKLLKVSCSQLTIYFVDVGSICQLHEQFFLDNSPTDCLSFPCHEKECPPFKADFLGEIFICPRVAIDYAKSHGVDHYEEVLLYLVHGLLHLVGFEDDSSNGKEEMYAKQKWIISLLLRERLTLNPDIEIGTVCSDVSCLHSLAR
ncbi:rRNA maturation RNase YbeY [Candidatus Similichlamydia epinepheli]|uniref:rRNA maturation RNase YbeY n=1 Tax=Candidatus Similichlamydia epinepheli TaxID=1903953 RepID=UPI000D3D0798|nr:rRNA maturation RNase YbeY [Candidatus Similichlamydia epinepheli]